MGKGTKGGRENSQISGADDDDALIFFSEIFRKYCAVFPTNTRIKLQLLPPISLPKTREREKECLEIPGVAFQSFLPLSPPEKKRSHLGESKCCLQLSFFRAFASSSIPPHWHSRRRRRRLETDPRDCCCDTLFCFLMSLSFPGQRRHVLRVCVFLCFPPLASKASFPSCMLVCFVYIYTDHRDAGGIR